jgi:hypothetical protein
MIQRDLTYFIIDIKGLNLLSIENFENFISLHYFIIILLNSLLFLFKNYFSSFRLTLSSLLFPSNLIVRKIWMETFLLVLVAKFCFVDVHLFMISLLSQNLNYLTLIDQNYLPYNFKILKSL